MGNCSLVMSSKAVRVCSSALDGLSDTRCRDWQHTAIPFQCGSGCDLDYSSGAWHDRGCTTLDHAGPLRGSFYLLRWIYSADPNRRELALILGDVIECLIAV